ncbi:hypothetical protein QYE76_002098 [Lolium multiflorum]|uniref:DUF4283 domain-containing protein n=1 Tax=Lolium multiflorum TaxID=4521 RepID=A0AAD8VZZ0_LOLMU|nr:hypothetical protein QYE76_002098 [Lolium multiflorum]
MERVKGMLKNLKLSEAEMAGLRIDEKLMEIADGAGKEVVEPKVLVKVLSEKLASMEGLKQSLGPIWCPIRGIKCSRRGENIFLITLLQQSGKKKALDCGPWMSNNDLVVVEDYDPDKSVEEYLFNSVPVWIRVLKLPLGKMNKATGEMIGEKVGVWLEADVGEDDLASGEFLRIKGGGGSGSGNRSYGFGERKGGDAGSNSLSWRKDEANKSGSATDTGKKTDKEEEVTSPVKNVVNKKNESVPAGSKKAIDWATLVELVDKEQEKGVQEPVATELVLEAAGKGVVASSTSMRAGKSPTENANKGTAKGITFKRRNRTTEGSVEIVGVKLGVKRIPDQMEVDEAEGQKSKKGRIEENKATPTKAGLSEQPCKPQ